MNNKKCDNCDSVGVLAKGLCERCYKAVYYASHKSDINAKAAAYYVSHRDDIAAKAAAYRATHKDEIAAQRAAYRASHKDEIRDKKGNIKMSENKTCTAFLGCHVAERLLKHVFSGAIEVMPYGNPGFDFICGKGLKIDCKSSTLRKDGNWMFTIKKNTTPDYFACLAFDNRADLNLQHFHLIPGHVVNNLIAFSFMPTTVHKWSQYEKPIDELLICCDSMKS